VGIRTTNDGDVLVAQVFDSGVGIPTELRQRVFDPFFSRREGGAGLGLTIVQQIVKVHHGEIRVADGPWGGACFDMHFAQQWQSEN
jgi:signal transduction histidine kinase